MQEFVQQNYLLCTNFTMHISEILDKELTKIWIS